SRELQRFECGSAPFDPRQRRDTKVAPAHIMDCAMLETRTKPTRTASARERQYGGRYAVWHIASGEIQRRIHPPTGCVVTQQLLPIAITHQAGKPGDVVHLDEARR